MKRLFAALLCLSMLVVAAVPASAEMSADLLAGQTFTSIMSFDEDIFANVTDAQSLVDAGAAHEHGGVYDVRVEEGGESGKALYFEAKQSDTQNSIGTDLEAIGAPTDWSGHTDLVVYIDTSNWGDIPNWGLVVQVDGQDYQIASNAARYISTDGKKWKRYMPDTCHWGGMTLPMKFKGWFRLELNQKSFTPFGEAGEGVEIDLSAVTGIRWGFYFNGGSAGKSVIMDSLGLLSGERITTAATTTTTKPTTTTTQKPTTVGNDTNTTTVAGGDADANVTTPNTTDAASFPIVWVIVSAAAGIVVGGGVMFLVLRKKKP